MTVLLWTGGLSLLYISGLWAANKNLKKILDDKDESS